MTPRTPILAALIWAAASATHAHDYKAGAIHIEHPHARATGPGQMAGAGYFTLNNTGTQADTLVSARAAVSRILPDWAGVWRLAR